MLLVLFRVGGVTNRCGKVASDQRHPLPSRLCKPRSALFWQILLHGQILQTPPASLTLGEVEGKKLLRPCLVRLLEEGRVGPSSSGDRTVSLGRRQVWCPLAIRRWPVSSWLSGWACPPRLRTKPPWYQGLGPEPLDVIVGATKECLVEVREQQCWRSRPDDEDAAQAGGSHQVHSCSGDTIFEGPAYTERCVLISVGSRGV